MAGAGRLTADGLDLRRDALRRGADEAGERVLPARLRADGGGLDEPHHAQSLLGEEEVQQVMEWNATAVAYPRGGWYTSRSRARQRVTPDAVAVVYGEQRLSYRELNEKAERLARYLAEAGVGEESRVGIYLRRSLEMMIGVVGVMKAGAAYVPVEVGQPRQRLEYMLEDAGVEWVLVESEMVESLPLRGVDVVVMDGAASEPAWLEEKQEPGLSEGEGRTACLHTVHVGVNR